MIARVAMLPIHTKIGWTALCYPFPRAIVHDCDNRHALCYGFAVATIRYERSTVQIRVRDSAHRAG